MVNNRNNNRRANEGQSNTSRSQLRSAAQQEDNTGSGSQDNNHPNPPATPVVLDANAIGLIVRQVVEVMTNQRTSQAQAAHVPQVAAHNEEQGDLPHQVHPEGNMGNYNQALKVINSMRPDSYDGTGEPVKVAYWFSHMERLFRNVACTEAEKVHIASLHLKDGASEWWESTRLAESPNLNWAMFKIKLTDRFFSRAMRDEKMKEFLYPETEGLNVTELAAKFNHLLHYAGPDAQSEEKKIWYFHEWMNPAVKPLMVRHGCTTLEQYVDEAYRVEVTLEESARKLEEKSKAKSGQQSQKFKGFKRPASPTMFEKSNRTKTETTRSGFTQQSGWSSGFIRCHNCGEAGHKSFHCKKEKRLCLTCGKEGHLQTYCRKIGQLPSHSYRASTVGNKKDPARDETVNVQSTGQNKGKTHEGSFSQGQRLYIMHQSDGQETPDK